MAIDNFIPEVWAARLQRHLDATLVYAQPKVCNREWEGEIKEAGDTVHINKIGDPTIKDYEPGEDMDAPEEPDGTTQALVVDQTKYFNVMVDDVNKAQANVNLLDQFGKRAGRGMAGTVDKHVATKMVAAATVNKVGTDAAPVEIKADGSGDLTPYEFAVELRRQIENSDVEITDLWIAINPDIEAEILLDDRYIESDVTIVRTGSIGKLAGFEVLRTTATPDSPGSGGAPVPNWKVLAGAGNYSTTFAGQIVEQEAFRPERRFGDAVKGLEVYGVKVLEPETLAVGHVAK